MRNCLNCGHRNPAQALYCGRCGGVLKPHQHDEPEDALAVLAGPGTPPVPESDLYRRRAAKSRHFLLTLICLLAVPVGLLISGWTRQVVPDPEDLAHPLVPMLGISSLLYGCILYSYMVAKTGEAGGARFGLNFLMGCLPPLIPLVWARLGGRPQSRPYLYLLADAALLGGGYALLKEYPALLALLVFCLLPFLIYHLFGCAITPLAHSLGLPPAVMTGWLCLGPDLLLILLSWKFMSSLDYFTLHQSLALTVAEIKVFFTPDEMLSLSTFSIAAVVYLLVTFAAWVKVVYDNLSLPV